MYVYCEHCIMAGHVVPPSQVETYLLEHDGRQSDDWFHVGDTEDEQRDYAALLLRHAKPGAAGSYARHVAREILAWLA
jgi:hypothetical protein